MLGKALREERERAGLSRGALRLRILARFETSPSVETIRKIETGRIITPRVATANVLADILSLLESKRMERERTARNTINNVIGDGRTRLLV